MGQEGKEVLAAGGENPFTSLLEHKTTATGSFELCLVYRKELPLTFASNLTCGARGRLEWDAVAVEHEFVAYDALSLGAWIIANEGWMAPEPREIGVAEKDAAELGFAADVFEQAELRTETLLGEE